MKKKIYFRADASSTIGYGHFIRTLALAEILKDDFECVFFTCHPTPYQIGEIRKVCSFVVLREENHYAQFLSYLESDIIVVLDNYFFDTNYQRAIKAFDCHLVCIDDMHDKHYVADVVINYGITNRSLFSIESYTQLCLGYNWALLRLPFLSLPQIERTGKIEKAIVCFGGSDVNNLTNKFVSFLQKEATIKKIAAIIGDQCQSDSLYNDPKVSYIHNLSADEMVNAFRQSDIAFLPASTVCLEALSQQIPVVSGYYVDNQKEIYTEYVNRNLVYPLGNLLELNFEKINYSSIQKKIKSLDKVNCSFGALHYKNLFQNLFIPINIEIDGLKFVDYRLLDKDQQLLIWKARNEECIRSQMVHSEVISWESHLIFIENLFRQHKKIYMAVYRDKELIGSVNIEYISVTQIERGLFILPQFWGDGNAVLIEKILSVFFQKKQITNIAAKILKSNSRSLRFHLKLGYNLISNDEKYNFLIKDLS